MPANDMVKIVLGCVVTVNLLNSAFLLLHQCLVLIQDALQILFVPLFTNGAVANVEINSTFISPNLIMPKLEGCYKCTGNGNVSQADAYQISYWRYIDAFPSIPILIFQIFASMVVLIVGRKEHEYFNRKKYGQYWQCVTLESISIIILSCFIGFETMDKLEFIVLGIQITSGIIGVGVLQMSIRQCSDIVETLSRPKRVIKFVSRIYFLTAFVNILLLNMPRILNRATQFSSNKQPSKIVTFESRSASYVVGRGIIITSVVASANILLVAYTFTMKRLLILRYFYGVELIGVVTSTVMIKWNLALNISNGVNFGHTAMRFLIYSIMLVGRIYVITMIYRRHFISEKLLQKTVKEMVSSNAHSMSCADFHAFLTRKLIKSRNILPDFTSPIGEGYFGTVYRGTLRLKGKSHEIALKQIKPRERQSEFSMLCEEVQIAAIAGNNPHIVRFHGLSMLDIGLVMLTEYCMNGNLQEYLRHLAGKNDLHSGYEGNYENNLEINQETMLDLWRFSTQITSGLDHLASRNIIHGDLATRNVLLSNDMLVKLTDFGLSRKLEAYQSYIRATEENVCFPWRWMAVETLKDMKFSKHSDIYALGVVLWEIFSLACIPYDDLVWCSDFIRQLENGLILHCPVLASKEMYHIMKSCWNLDPTMRPEAAYVLSMLENLGESAFIKGDEATTGLTTSIQ